MSKDLASYRDPLLVASAIPNAPGTTTLDLNGIQLYKWLYPLNERTDCCGKSIDPRYTCCSCYALAQIESRMDIAPFNSVLIVYGLLVMVSSAIGVLTPYVIYWSDNDAVRLTLWFVVMVTFVAAVTWWWVCRSSIARTKVRERFQIPGSVQDRKLAFWQSTRMMRQIVHHLKIEDAGTFGRVDTLPAYTH